MNFLNLPKIRLHTAFLASFRLLNAPSIWIFVSASTTKFNHSFQLSRFFCLRAFPSQEWAHFSQNLEDIEEINSVWEESTHYFWKRLYGGHFLLPILVLVAFSMTSLVRPSLPAMRPIALLRWSPFREAFTSLIWYWNINVFIISFFSENRQK